MSDQSSEFLIVNGERLSISLVYPLEYLFINHEKPTTAQKHWQIDSGYTSDNRGYQGTWEIVNNELYLIDIYTYFIRYKGFLFWKKYYEVAANVSDLFPEAVNNRVKATWFSGPLSAFTKNRVNPVDDVLQLRIGKGDVISYQWCHIELKEGKKVRIPYDRAL